MTDVAVRVIILKNCFSFVTIFGKNNDHININYVGGYIVPKAIKRLQQDISLLQVQLRKDKKL